jgi:hypothetical protein
MIAAFNWVLACVDDVSDHLTVRLRRFRRGDDVRDGNRIAPARVLPTVRPVTTLRWRPNPTNSQFADALTGDLQTEHSNGSYGGATLYAASHFEQVAKRMAAVARHKR